MRLITSTWLVEGGRVSLSLYGRVAFHTMKGPYHIWASETLAEKTACYADLATRNKARYKEDKRDWEAEQVAHRLYATRAHPGRKAEFKHTRATGAFTLEEGKGGIN
jgi:hypothetical protein